MNQPTKILVIEDEPDISEIYSLTLQTSIDTAIILNAANAAEAIHHIE